MTAPIWLIIDGLNATRESQEVHISNYDPIYKITLNSL